MVAQGETLGISKKKEKKLWGVLIWMPPDRFVFYGWPVLVYNSCVSCYLHLLPNIARILHPVNRQQSTDIFKQLDNSSFSEYSEIYFNVATVSQFPMQTTQQTMRVATVPPVVVQIQRVCVYATQSLPNDPLCFRCQRFRTLVANPLVGAIRVRCLCRLIPSIRPVAILQHFTQLKVAQQSRIVRDRSLLTRSDRRRSRARGEGCILQHIAAAVQWKTEYELIRSTALTQPGGDAILYVEGGKVVHVVRSSSQYAMNIGISRPGTTQIIPGKVYVVSSSAKKTKKRNLKQRLDC